MNVKELRIGNLVYGLYDDENGKQQKTICEILALDSMSNLGDGWEILAGDTGDSDTETYDDFKGIPITEEWLNKFLWVWNPETDSFEKSQDSGGDARMHISKGTEGSYKMFNYVLRAMISERFWYVHELQNLYFALTRKELEFPVNAKSRR